MKLKLVGKDYIMIEPCHIVKKTSTSLIFNPKAGITSTVITYKVIDAGENTQFKNKIIGAHRANVFKFTTLYGEYSIVDIKAIVFIAEPDKDEITKSEAELESDKKPMKSLIET